MRILIVDDEDLVRESLKRSLEQLNYTDVVMTADGMQAMNLIRNDESIQIVISDIRMPSMDGLTLLAEAKSYNPGINIIFFSGYDLFEYAREALKGGAIGYLLKPVRTDELQELLDRCLISMQDERRRNAFVAKLEQRMEAGVQFMRKHILLDVLKEHSGNEEYLRKRFAELNVSLPEVCHIVLHVSIDHFYLLSSETSLLERDLLLFTLDNIVSETISNQNVIAYFFEVEDGLGVLLNYPANHPLAEVSTVHVLCDEMRRNVQLHSKFTVTIGIGQSVDHVTQLSQSLATAGRAVQRRLIKGGNHVFSYSGVSGRPVQPVVIEVAAESKLLLVLQNLDIETTMERIRLLYEPYRRTETVSAASVMKLNYQLIMLIMKFAMQEGVDADRMPGNEIVLYNQVNSLAGVDAILQWYRDWIGSCFEQVRSTRANSPYKIIHKAREYIQSAYQQDLTLENVADYVHLSPAYFSKLFKEEAGESFSEYLLHYRLTIAGRLLKEGVYKANRVAEMVGFRDVKYFYKLFKKMTGLPPGKYRKG